MWPTSPCCRLLGRCRNMFLIMATYRILRTISTKSKENNLDTIVDFDTESNILGDLLLSLLPFALIIGIWIYLMRRMSSGAGGGAGGQIFNIGKSKAKLFDEKTDTRTSFKDVAGLEGAKEEVQEIVEFLKNPDKYTSLGGKIPP